MPTDPRDYKLDIGSLAGPDASRDSESGSQVARPYLSVHFACCGVYCRIYRNAEATAYVGHCPRCARPAKFLVGDGGTDQRFFVVE